MSKASVIESKTKTDGEYRSGIEVNEIETKKFLTSKNWPAGLQDVIVKGLKKIPIRYFICDDSGSMLEPDGKIVIQSNSGCDVVDASRWDELSEALKFHIELVKCSGTQAEFRFLNGDSVMISPQSPENADVVRLILEDGPGGATPLCANIEKVVESIRKHEATLRASNQKACVIIATDGESSDGEIIDAMKPLETLPCWVVIRLCTNDENIVNYWSKIDKNIEVDIDVLDDLFGEANEVYAKNNWFTYGEPIHRVREFGIPVRELDLLDERSLMGPQIRTIAHAVYGGDISSYPYAEIDGKAFIDFIKQKQRETPLVYDLISYSLKPWINVSALSD